jgi:uncharacterized sulfatase
MPLVWAGPGSPAKGKRSGRTVEMLDIYPTLAELCGLAQVPANLHGKSLRPLLERPDAPSDKPAVSQVERGNGGNRVSGYSLRTERYRYTEWKDGTEGEELYDYREDPREMQNLSGSKNHQKIRSELRATLRRISKGRGREIQ